MTKHIDTGRRGEELAARWLIINGFQILFKNWRYKRCEIDIIAQKKGILHFIEVKTSNNDSFGFPEQRVGSRKWCCILKSSHGFMIESPRDIQFQYDIISIMIEKKNFDCQLFECAFCPAAI